MKISINWVLFNIAFWLLFMVVTGLAAQVQETAALSNDDLVARSEAWQTIVGSWAGMIYAGLSTLLNMVLLLRKSGRDSLIQTATLGKRKSSPK